MGRVRRTLLIGAAATAAWLGADYLRGIESGSPGPDKDRGYRVAYQWFSGGYQIELWLGSEWSTVISPPRAYQFVQVRKRLWDRDGCRVVVSVQYHVEDSAPIGGETSVEQDFCTGQTKVSGIGLPRGPNEVSTPEPSSPFKIIQ